MVESGNFGSGSRRWAGWQGEAAAEEELGQPDSHSNLTTLEIETCGGP